MNKEIFKQADIDYWNNNIKLDNRLRNTKKPIQQGLELINNTQIIIPAETFCNLIHYRRPEFVDLLPYKVTVNYFDGDPEYYWTKHSAYTGLHHEDGSLTIQLKKDMEHSQLSLLWLLLHEFRHKIQFSRGWIKSNIWNSNLTYFEDYLKAKGNSQSAFEHTFHEIMPYEIDANIFACELLQIDYPGSKFEINDYTIGLLK